MQPDRDNTATLQESSTKLDKDCTRWLDMKPHTPRTNTCHMTNT